MINTVEKIYSVYDGTHISYSVTYIDSNLSASVPLDTENSDYQAIQKWIADGGTVIDNGGGE
tara:strand:- start:116 stop:301 length:186 start_codon:yes stop_codon:yes gene_type:complete